MNNNQQLGSFGLNWTFLGDIRLTKDSQGNITILNSGIQSLLPEQLSGTALYLNNPDNLGNQSLLGQGLASPRLFNVQTDSSYQAEGKDKATLTQVGNIYQLKEQDGSVIVFRTDGQLDYVQDTNGFRITAAYTNNRLTKLTSSNGDSFNVAYNTQGRINQITDQTGQTNTYTYDINGQSLLSVQDSKGTTTFTYGNPYDPTLVTSVTYADGRKVNYDYDENGRLQQVILGEGRQALAYTYTYDAAGDYTFTEPNGAKTTAIYDETNHSRTVTDALGRVVQYNYDAAGLLDSVIAPDGSKVDYSFNESDQLKSIIDPLGNQTTFSYESNFGKIQTVTDARGNDLAYSYDTKGNLASITYEDDTHQDYSYNAKGQLTQSVNRRGQVTNYSYNDKYQLTQALSSNGSIINYGYNATTGELNSITDSKGATQINYDQTNNQLTIGYATGRSLKYTFDALGRKTQLVTQDGTNTKTVNYSYDAFGQLDKLTDGAGNLIVDYVYSPTTGLLEREINGNGSYTTYTYDLAGQITSLVNYATNNVINSRFDYTYDSFGRRTQVATLDGTWNYSYDKTGQLTRAVFASTNSNIASQDLTYVYDAVGNRIQTIENGVTSNYTTNNLNQYTQSGTTTYTYDADGNLVSKKLGTQTWTYSYDDQNRLIQVIDSSNNKTQYEYDVFGNRNATIYNGQRTDYLVDPFGMGNVLAEYNNSGQLVANYTHGLGLVNRTSGNSTSYYDFDAIGSTVGLTGTSGTVLNRYSYRPFGEDFYETETVANSFEYVGQWGVTEEANGLDFMRARFYDSKAERFVLLQNICN